MRKLKTVQQVFYEELHSSFEFSYPSELKKLKKVVLLSHFSLEELNYLWRLFSDRYCASFLNVGEETIEQFLEWLEDDSDEEEDY